MTHLTTSSELFYNQYKLSTQSAGMCVQPDSQGIICPDELTPEGLRGKGRTRGRKGLKSHEGKNRWWQADAVLCSDQIPPHSWQGETCRLGRHWFSSLRYLHIMNIQLIDSWIPKMFNHQACKHLMVWPFKATKFFVSIDLGWEVNIYTELPFGILIGSSQHAS